MVTQSLEKLNRKKYLLINALELQTKNKEIIYYKNLSKYINIFYKKLIKKLLKFLNNLKRKVKIRNKKNLYQLTSNRLNINQDKNFLEKKVLSNIRYKHVTGFRLEVSGRITRRYTASRSISKLRYKGNLLNIDSSYRGLSSVLLKGNLKSNVQHTKLKSKTRIGSFGIKG